ncbi:PQQ-dependent sugar dehydrogenase [Oceanibaculum nanhaiense]|uniref:PQQ-dependent sugar dehydrogenase n=1 Tax=Oceanibaculum nanhaiense TaxID=1909734 RepID=UPI00396EA844
MLMRLPHYAVFCTVLLLAFPVAAQQTQRFSTEKAEITVETVARGLENPWSLAFLPDGRMLVTERPGRLRIIGQGGAVSAPLEGVPEVAAGGQGGLLDVILGPDFADSRLIYLSFAEPGEGSANGTAVARGRLSADGRRIEGLEVIFSQKPKIASRLHFGSRLAFGRDGTLYATTGERFGNRDMAQDLDNHLGKLIRLEPDGSVPADNPFVGQAGALPEIFSYGHRNPQGMTVHPVTGRLWLHEHGARGGDEINLPEAGKNYGWPVISYGVHYSGARIGEGTSKPGMEQPIHYWDPSIAPSGMAFYHRGAIPAWEGNLFVGALAGQHLARLEIEGERVTGEEKLLGDLGARFRDVRMGPDGNLYALTDSDEGRILRIRPAR